MAKPGKWACCPVNPPGRIQASRFNDATADLNREHNQFEEVWGVVGGEEHRYSKWSPFGGATRADVRAAQLAIGERYGWTVSRENVNEIIGAIRAALPALVDNRPVNDKRKTVEQVAEQKAAADKAQAENAALEADLRDNTCPEFRATIGRLAKVSDKSVIRVFAWWKEYEASSRAADQSAILHEFVRHYQAKFQRTVETLDAAWQEPPAPTAPAALGTVSHNRTHDGVEIKLNEKPTPELRRQLEYAGFRITRRPPWKWYHKFSADKWAVACAIVGVTTPCPSVETPDRFDMAVEDRMADACGLGGGQ